MNVTAQGGEPMINAIALITLNSFRIGYLKNQVISSQGIYQFAQDKILFK